MDRIIKIMNKKIKGTLSLGIFIFIVLVATYIFGDLISKDNSGMVYQAEQIVRSILVLLLAWVAMRLCFVCFIDPINEKRKRPIPNIVKDAIAFVIFLIAGIFIVTSIYNQPAFSLITILGAPGIAIGLACQDTLKDCIEGITMDLTADFAVGDWVQLKNGLQGKIVEMKLTGVDLILPDNTTIYLANSDMANGVINLSKPNRDFMASIHVTLEHSIPIERARRIMQGAVSSAPLVFEHKSLVVAEAIKENGISYGVFFGVKDRDLLFETRHQVISSIVSRLHKLGMKICQVTGEVNVKNIDHRIDVLNDKEVTTSLDALEMSGLLEGCENSIKQQFAQKMRFISYRKGDLIVKEGDDGDTMFIIAEGIVDVLTDVVIENKNNKKENTIERTHLAYISDGGYFGEMALLQGEKRSATIIAHTDVIIYEIKRDIVKWFVREYPDFTRKLSLSIIRRNEENRIKKEDVINSHYDEEKVASEFMEAIRNFLGRDW